MSVITICCHGTGYNSVKGEEQGELVAWVQRHILGTQIQMHNGTISTLDGSFIVLEGPGHFDARVATPNMLDPKTGAEKDLRYMTKGEQRLFKNLAGTVGGHGWDTNIAMAMNMLQQCNAYRRITRINMVGWSRGAVTCIRLANALADATHAPWAQHIKCNIFAADPVAGTWKGMTKDDTRNIPRSVENYVAILAMHEKRRFFTPQDQSRMTIAPDATSAVFLPMPGVHNGAVIGRSDAADVTSNLACRFLQLCGTPMSKIRRSQLSTPGEMCKAYARMNNGLDGYKARGFKAALSNFVQGTTKARTYTAHMEDYVKSPYWINEHHRRCFKSAFAGFYDFAFNPNPGGPLRAVRQVSPPLDAALNSGAADDLKASLMARGIVKQDNGMLKVQAGAGFNGPTAVSYKWPASLARLVA